MKKAIIIFIAYVYSYFILLMPDLNFSVHAINTATAVYVLFFNSVLFAAIFGLIQLGQILKKQHKRERTIISMMFAASLLFLAILWGLDYMVNLFFQAQIHERPIYVITQYTFVYFLILLFKLLQTIKD